jgi:hypothetical protein
MPSAKSDEHQFDGRYFINDFNVLTEAPDWRSTKKERDIDQLLAKGDGLVGEDADISF